ncbi:hypothetical protein HNW13_013320 [Shewanella sp. BF02_Schw]|jgi:hypothetical protein|uniref:hypothetical protein n=1 Tax=Shewanella sp. BF02_Schw TaxID=394908 RepID=UPI0017870249|nr:hypothetical protein [Shewanella sp. BF02_Schw]MBO1896743.1 hypothetical protein [Shewanella sp. BF02_Schw]|tara:strand:+ start:263 stop:442 length:180 start_codon:yes stop_codon:yes gene_type:complete
MNNKNQPVSLSEIGKKLGIEGGVSMLAVAEKIGYTIKPIELSELDKAVDKYLNNEVHSA